MTKTLSFFLPYAKPGLMKALAKSIKSYAAMSLLLLPFGLDSELLQKNNPFHGFDYKDALLTMVRIEKLEKVDCEKLLSTAKTLPLEGQVGKDFSAWAPWEQDELEGVEDCDDFPCKVKLSSAETAFLKTLPKQSRLIKYEDLVLARTLKYQKLGLREEYEFPGAPQDPWSAFAKTGLKSTLTPISDGKLIYRKNNFSMGQTKPLRQVMNEKWASNASEVLRETRDVYTNHFFDSWGEYLDLNCTEGAGQLTQGLVVELDLLKKGDLLSLISRSRMREAFHENGAKYLDKIAARLKLGK